MNCIIETGHIYIRVLFLVNVVILNDSRYFNRNLISYKYYIYCVKYDLIAESSSAFSNPISYANFVCSSFDLLKSNGFKEWLQSKKKKD